MKNIYSLLFLLSLLFTTTSVQSQIKESDDPDIPKFASKIPKQEYLNAREAYINFKRGLPANLPYNPRLKAINDMHGFDNRTRKRTAKTTISSNWVELGPAPIPNGHTEGISVPVTGRVTSIAIHPSNPNILYVGTANGGIYRSLNAGTSWTSIFDAGQSLAIGALALAPSNPSILFVGTGESNLSQDSYAGIGLYRIENADATPTLVGPIDPGYGFTYNKGGNYITGTFTYRSISKILVDPSNPANIFVSTSTGTVGNPGNNPPNNLPPIGLLGFYKSTNALNNVGSISFQKLSVTPAGGIDLPNTGFRRITDMVMDPGNANNIVCWVLGDTAVNDGGIYRTTNALAANPNFIQTFRETTAGGSRGNLSIVKEGTDVVVYAATGESTSTSTCGSVSGVIRKSRDGGLTWSAPLGGKGFCGGQCYYDIAVAVAPNDSNKILIGGSALGDCSKIMQISSDAGNTFSANEFGLHADSHIVAFAPSAPNIVYTGNDGGIFKSVNGGSTWVSVNTSTFKATQFQSLALHPLNPNYTIGGTQDNGTVIEKSNGTFSSVDGGDGGYSAIDQNAVNNVNVTMYHTYFNQTNKVIAYVFSDSGELTNDNSWNAQGCYPDTGTVGVSHNGIGCNDQVLFYAPLVLGPGKPNTVYLGTDRLYRNAQHGLGDTNIVVSQSPISATGVISALAISGNNDKIRLVGLTNGQVWYTITGSSILTQFTPPYVKRNGQTKEVGRIAYDSIKNIAYVTYGGYDVADSEHIWKCSNLLSGSPVWVKSGDGIPDIPCNAFAFDPKNTDILYIGTDIGVFQSLDGGTSWASYNNGLPSIPVFDMSVHPVTRVLRIATHGRGLWETATQSPLPVTFISLTAIPKKFGKVFLEWLTSSEFNSKGFELQRALNTSVNINWQPITFVAGAGNSNSTMRYNFDDYPSGGSKFLYRIKQIDNDGNFKYSDVKEVELKDFDYALFQNVPNPAGSYTNIKYQLPVSGKVSMVFYNSIGAVIKILVNEEKEPGIYEVKLNTSGLPNGNYYYKISINDFQLTKQLNITK